MPIYIAGHRHDGTEKLLIQTKNIREARKIAASEMVITLKDLKNPWYFVEMLFPDKPNRHSVVLRINHDW